MCRGGGGGGGGGVVEGEAVVAGEVAEMRTDPWRRIARWQEVVGYDLLRKGVP